MSEEDKDYYRQKAKGGGLRLPKRPASGVSGGASGGGGGSVGTQLTAQGIPVAVYAREEQQRRLDEETMRRRIGSMIQQVPLMTGNQSLHLQFLFWISFNWSTEQSLTFIVCRQAAFPSHPLYLMYGNYFYKDEKIHEYAPAELAMIKFSFQNGVMARFHTFISPGKWNVQNVFLSLLWL